MYSLDHSGQPRVWTVVCEQCLAPIHCLIGQLSGDVTPPVHQLPTNSTKSEYICKTYNMIFFNGFYRNILPFSFCWDILIFTLLSVEIIFKFNSL